MSPMPLPTHRPPNSPPPLLPSIPSDTPHTASGMANDLAIYHNAIAAISDLRAAINSHMEWMRTHTECRQAAMPPDIPQGSNRCTSSLITDSADAAVNTDGISWWCKESDASVVAYLHRRFKGHKFSAGVPVGVGVFRERNAQEDASFHDAGKVKFYVSSEVVVKVYCVGVAGQSPERGTPLCNDVANACLDACATQLACKLSDWYCDAFGLILGGMAYICIGRHRLKEWTAAPEVKGRYAHQFAINTGVVHLDCHSSNYGLNPFAMERVELFDFERAAWYGDAQRPDVNFFINYATNVTPDSSQTAKLKCLQDARALGLDITHRRFRIMVYGGKLFETAFTANLFSSEPLESLCARL
jgi:hypothetical protein